MPTPRDADRRPHWAPFVRVDSILRQGDIDIAIVGRPNVAARGRFNRGATTKMPVAEKVYRGTALDISRRQSVGRRSTGGARR